ncbi:hypothetical protein FOQG_10834 [Fusarium oxysporum f. sp. raphani 54005]|uniref:Uncharacterized protein n=2 Tax=Fusarium oxysporum TaxID=5507 RepID=X0BSR3_FUSOX|nr:hypothetical protein FOQG_10834 [Fusarium oxysporum f. sp. raphani 54005]EXL69774.1 hypothetical protein FOPG_14303 [Fusarium oxysporum f. sp. conglutinans race 2 54008]
MFPSTDHVASVISQPPRTGAKSLTARLIVKL